MTVLKDDYKDGVSQLLMQSYKQISGETKSADCISWHETTDNKVTVKSVCIDMIKDSFFL